MSWSSAELADGLADCLLWLCSIASPTGEEEALANALADRLEGQSDAPVRRHGRSLVVPLWRSERGPRIVLAGHLDHVRTAHDGPPRREGDRVYGPGASDMKSGLCLMLDLAEHGPRAELDLTLVFYASEEGPSEQNELGPVLENDPELRKAEFAVLLEPTDNRLELGCGGSVHGRVTYHGKSAHSARPWQGKNAIYAGLPLLNRLCAMQPEERETDGLVWTNLVVCTTARGGRARNVVPDSFELNLNHRFGPETTLAESERRLSELVAGEAELEIVDRSPAASPGRKHPWAEAWIGAGVRDVKPKLGYTDVARFRAEGIPAVNFGPGTVGQAHQANEWASVAELVAGKSILGHWLRAVGR